MTTDKLAAAEQLATNHLLTYFGGAPDVGEFSIGPIVLEKGSSKLALYGLGNFKDETLNKTFRTDKVTWDTVRKGVQHTQKSVAAAQGQSATFGSTMDRFGREDKGRDDEVFSIFMIHQNRFRGLNNGLPTWNSIREQYLPEFLQLVIWGHEHECLIEPVKSRIGTYDIMQPGSTVPTSYIA